MRSLFPAAALLMIFLTPGLARCVQDPASTPKDEIFPVGPLKPRDSRLKVKVGQKAPDFSLPSLNGQKVSLGDYLGKKIVVLSFVPAAWTR